MDVANPPIQAASKSRLGALQISLLVLGLIVVAGIAYVAYDRFMARPVVAPLAGQPVAARKGSIAATVSTTGSVVPGRQAKLTVAGSGRIKEMSAKLGDEVKAG